MMNILEWNMDKNKLLSEFNKEFNKKSVYKKFASLKSDLEKMGSAVVAFSGGVDSTFLLKTASEVLGDNVIAVTLRSPSFPQRELNRAIDMAKIFKVKHLIVKGNELENPDFIKNDRLRCYFCKKEEFSKIISIAENNNLAFTIDGQNFDDLQDYRPGADAANELGVISPLRNNGLSKKEIRFLSKEMGIPDWDRPSFACLASRIPYGTKISKNLLKKIDYLENYLINEGFRQVRVRHHREIARIEIPKEDFPILFEEELIQKIISKFKKCGYLYVTIDLEGYSSGSMNKLLRNES